MSTSNNDDQWKHKLTDEQYHVCREKGTEAPFSGEYYTNKKDGIYRCVCCGEKLFASDSKYDSGSGWPSFFQALNETAVEEQVDKSHAMLRTEVHCRQCGSHLGHIFPDGPAPTGLRYCINSISLQFEEDQSTD